MFPQDVVTLDTEKFQLLVLVAQDYGYLDQQGVFEVQDIWHTLSLQIHLVIQY